MYLRFPVRLIGTAADFSATAPPVCEFPAADRGSSKGRTAIGCVTT